MGSVEGELGVVIVDKNEYLVRPGSGNCLLAAVTCPINTSNANIQSLVRQKHGMEVLVQGGLINYSCTVDDCVCVESRMVRARLKSNRRTPDNCWRWIGLHNCESTDVPPSLVRMLNLWENSASKLPATIDESATFAQKLANIRKELSALQNDLMDIVKFKERQLEYLLRYFTWLCWPNEGMCFEKFSEFCASIKNEFSSLPTIEPRRLMRSFDQENHGCLSFETFVTGLAILQPSLPCDNKFGALRTKFIFSYFASDKTPHVFDMNSLKMMDKFFMERAREKEKFSKQAKLLFDDSSESGVNQVQFIKSVGGLTLRGTSRLLRLDKPSFPEILNLFNGRVSPSVNNIYDEHMDIFDKVTTLPTSKLNVNIAGVVKQLPTPEKSSVQAWAIKVVESMQFFSGEYEMPNHGRKSALSWGKLSMQQLANDYMKICDSLVESSHSKSSSYCINVQSPALIVGSLGGDMVGLDLLGQYLWPLGIENTVENVVFLGDYGGQTGYTFEVLCTLFSNLAMSCGKLTLLSSTIDEVKFKKECEDKFGAETGAKVHTKTINVLDSLPQSVIIDKKIYCTHSGIPPPSLFFMSPLEINIDHRTLTHSRNSQFSSSAIVDETGFSSGTGENSELWYSEIAVQEFVKKHHLTHVIVKNTDGKSAESPPDVPFVMLRSCNNNGVIDELTVLRILHESTPRIINFTVHLPN